MKIALAFGEDRALAAGEPEDSVGVEAVRDQVDAVEEACASLGWEPRRVLVGDDLPSVVDPLRAAGPDVVFSMVESIGGDARREASAAVLFEWLGLPYTGSPPFALALALRKPLARAALAEAGIAVPRGAVLERGDEPLDLRYPAIVKPSREDGSHGIRSESVVADEAGARARAAYVIERYAQPALVEEFVPGRELNVSLLGPADSPTVLPLREIGFALPDSLPRLVTYEAKWLPGSVEYRGTPSEPVTGPQELVEVVSETARAAYRAIGLRDYGRVDIRLDADGTPVVIDVNPNPDIAPSGNLGLAGAAADVGMSFPDLVAFVVDQALSRRLA
ncbi:MAG TPA: ATP-grasp domain-containing protein [Gaiellaceae bacterium]|nr:ATP-grasp domain-containing protein [Gaiellaceae bacterium]